MWEGEVTYVFFREKIIFLDINFLRSKIGHQSKISDVRNMYTTVNLSSNKIFLRYADIMNSPFTIIAHFISRT